VPDAVRRKAEAVGPEGVRWIAELPATVAGLEAEWGVRVGAPITGGSGGYVAQAVATDGTAAILKIAIPDGLQGQSPFAREMQTLRLGAGSSYVRVLQTDTRRRAMLQERLGRPLRALELPVEEQIDIIAATLQRAWQPVPDAEPLRTGAEQAAWLRDYVRARWEDLDRPCPEQTITRRRSRTARRARRHDCRADPRRRSANVLEDPNEPGRFKLIDPDGMRSEPAHDLAIPLRDWTPELLAGDPVARGLAWCARLGARGSVAPRAIWEWAFLERVSTGLFMLSLHDPIGATLLAVADHRRSLSSAGASPSGQRRYDQRLNAFSLTSRPRGSRWPAQFPSRLELKRPDRRSASLLANVIFTAL
jgi:streptomycin 6-kinase